MTENIVVFNLRNLPIKLRHENNTVYASISTIEYLYKYKSQVTSTEDYGIFDIRNLLRSFEWILKNEKYPPHRITTVEIEGQNIVDFYSFGAIVAVQISGPFTTRALEE